ncbi:MAG: N-acetylmuramoyl-L-alanine amidase [Chthoniobacterales bacterium]
MLRRTAQFLALGSLFALASCETTSVAGRKDTTRTFNTVVVDAGHGGKDSGASRRYSPAEKVIALDVAQRLNRKLRASRFQTVMTRNTDVFIPLDQRVAIGNRQPNSIFVSVHFNDSRSRRARGVETYYASPHARSLAQRISQKMLTLPGASGGGVRKANFRVVRNAAYPSVLVECGYLSNRGDAGRSRSGDYRDMVAEKIAEAILEERYGRGYRDPAQTAAAGPRSSGVFAR